MGCADGGESGPFQRLFRLPKAERFWRTGTPVASYTERTRCPQALPVSSLPFLGGGFLRQWR